MKVILYWIGEDSPKFGGNSVLNQSNVVKSRGETFNEICELNIKSFRGRTPYPRGLRAMVLKFPSCYYEFFLLTEGETTEKRANLKEREGESKRFFNSGPKLMR